MCNESANHLLNCLNRYGHSVRWHGRNYQVTLYSPKHRITAEHPDPLTAIKAAESGIATLEGTPAIQGSLL